MNLKNVFYGLFLCSFASLALAGDVKAGTFNLIDEQNERIDERVERQMRLFDYKPEQKSVAANIGEIEDKEDHPFNKIVDNSPAAHPRDEGVMSEENQSNADSSSKPADQEKASQDEAKGFSFLSIREIASQQLFALTAGAMVAGYCLYKVWDMFAAQVEQVEEELKISLTHQDREVLFALIQAMANDIQNLRENKHEASLVSQLDISSLSEVIAPECKAIMSNFVELYNAIDLSGNNIEFIIMFYGEFERAVQALLMQAEII